MTVTVNCPIYTKKSAQYLYGSTVFIRVVIDGQITVYVVFLQRVFLGLDCHSNWLVLLNSSNCKQD